MHNVFYRIFDLSFTKSSHIYGQYRASDINQVSEIKSNRNLIIDAVSAKNLLILQQVHGNVVVDADTIVNYDTEPLADGAVTTRNNLALGIQTADCVPVLLYSLKPYVIGALHCGWKSAKSDIIKNAALMMMDKGATQIFAIVGPSIAQKSYEVSDDYYQDFIRIDKSNERFFVTQGGKINFDLPKFVVSKLENEDIKLEKHISEDTYSNPAKYPSYRRKTHSNTYSKEPLKTILSVIMLN